MGPKIEKLACHFVFMKGLKYKNEMLTVLFWVKKCKKKKEEEKKTENRFLYLYKFMDYNKVWVSRSIFHEKAQKKLQGDLFSGFSLKIPNLAKIYIF